jgi:peroxiredoxin/uncharacterized membrane protein YphA (DoxX/SURF4 family)
MTLESLIEVTLLFARLGLAIIFCMAGVAKLSDLNGSRQAVRDFGVPPRFARLIGTGLPVVELVIAGGLLPVVTARYAAAASAVILIGFMAAMLINMAQGRRPDCGCFGQAWPDPVSNKTLGRNAVLMVLALFVAFEPGASLTGPLEAFTGGQAAGLLFAAVLLGLVALQGWLIFRLLRQNGRLLLCLETMEQQLDSDSPPVWYTPEDSLPVGAPAPNFRLPDRSGSLISLDDYLSLGQKVLLVFTSPKCLACQDLLPELAAWQRRFGRDLTMVTISQGSQADNTALFAGSSLKNVLFQRAGEVADAYQVYGTPSAVLVGPRGELLSGIAAGGVNIRRLISERVVEPIGAGLGR